MPNATLIINQPGHATREIQLSDGVVSIGRALDNTLCLDGDTNVSRYHAVIEAREDGFWLSDLGSSNGTTLNDTPVESERRLKDGDLICVGGASTIDVLLNQTPPQLSKAPDGAAHGPLPVEPAIAPDVAAAAPPVPVQPAPGGPSPILLIAGVSTGLLLTAVVAIFLISKFSSPCQGTVRILSPQTGSTVRGPVRIHVEAEGTKCIERVSFQLDGNEFASAEASPYDVMLDPAAVPGLSGGNHVLSVLVEDEGGKKKIQEETVLLAFDTGSSPNSSNGAASTNQATGTTDQQATDARSTSTVTTIDIKDMCSGLAKQISGKSDYVYDREFIQQVQTHTGEYLGGGFYKRAQPFRDVINDSFINEQGLPPPLGYVMAMSRSQFNLAKNRAPSAAPAAGSGSGEGLWQVPSSLAQGAGYIGRCGSTTLADPDQKCAALVASAYMKALVVDLFAGDFLYAAACFGMTPKEAGQWRDGLPADRRDFWKVIKSSEQRDRVVRFFAAGIVGENPQKFGLTGDRPLSNLYPKK